MTCVSDTERDKDVIQVGDEVDCHGLLLNSISDDFLAPNYGNSHNAYLDTQ